MVMDTNVRQRNKELAKQKKRLTEIQTRIKELDNLFQRIYEDNISGKLSDERFMKLSKGYDAEQADLQKEMAALQENIQQEEKQSVRFLSIVKKYMLLIKAVGGVYRKSRLSTIMSGYSTTQRLLFGKEKRYSTSNAIPHILNLKNILTRPLLMLGFWIKKRYET